MSHTISRRVGVVVGLAVAAVAGVAMAQQLQLATQPREYRTMPDRGKGAAPPLKVALMLSDGQVLEVNCLAADITFSSGGVLKVTDLGAVPVSPSLPNPISDAANFEGPHRPAPRDAPIGITGPPALYNTPVSAPDRGREDAGVPLEEETPPFGERRENP